IERPIFAHLPVILKTDGSKMGKRDRDKAVRDAATKRLAADDLDVAALAGLAGMSVERLAEWLADSKSQLDPAEHDALIPHIAISPADLPAISVHDFRKAGYLPEVLNNFLALLGWSSGTDRERFGMAELVEA